MTGTNHSMLLAQMMLRPIRSKRLSRLLCKAIAGVASVRHISRLGHIIVRHASGEYSKSCLIILMSDFVKMCHENGPSLRLDR